MMKEKRGEPLTYKSFVIQTWPLDHIVCGGGGVAIVYTKNEFFGLKWYLDNYSAQRIIELAE